MKGRKNMNNLQKDISSFKRFSSFILAVIMVITPLIPGIGVPAQASEARNDSYILIEDGIQVSMSSSAMPAASSALNTGGAGTARPNGWLQYDPVPVEFRNTQMDSIDLVSRTIEEEDAKIIVDESITFQNFEGIGASIDHHSVYQLLQLPDNQRREVIRHMIDPFNGMGMSLFRVPIGTSDFRAPGQDNYSYYDTLNREAPENPDWHNETGNGFSIQNSIDFGLVQILQEFLEEAVNLGIEGEVRFFGTPWSPPGWMKVNHAGNLTNNPTGMGGGSFNPAHVDNLAMYYVRWLEEYALQGISFYGMTIQNQSGMNMNMANFPSMGMPAQQQFEVATRMRELIAESDILTPEQQDFRIWGLDMSWGDGTGHTVGRAVMDILDANNSNALDGIALHDYRANPTFDGLREIHGRGFQALVSERSLNGTFGMDRTVRYFRNYATSHNHWVTVSPSSGPGALQTMVIRNTEDNGIRFLPEAHMVGQFGQIRPGYTRVYSTMGRAETDNFGISNVVFQNPDNGELVMVVVNNSNDNATFTVVGDIWQFEAEIPATTVATYRWNPSEIIPRHEVTFAVVGGNGTLNATVEGTEITSPMSIDEGSEVVFTATPNTGFQVKEWRVNGEVVDNMTTSLALSDIQEAVNITVEFEAAPVEHTVIFDRNDGSANRVISEELVLDGELIRNVPTNPERVGYIFNGWTLDQEGTIPFDPTLPITDGKTVYAQWRAAETPGIPGIPPIPPLPPLPGFPSLPSLPSLPSFPSLPSLPSLPPFPSLPTLPSLPSFPSFPWRPSLPWRP